ncbi:MAG: hypothetical protein SWX82_29640, partial [Cyanobacteriota bacterium]|nr:hypothetical protein [Cyanobacteriota bacterium]
ADERSPREGSYYYWTIVIAVLMSAGGASATATYFHATKPFVSIDFSYFSEPHTSHTSHTSSPNQI